MPSHRTNIINALDVLDGIHPTLAGIPMVGPSTPDADAYTWLFRLTRAQSNLERFEANLRRRLHTPKAPPRLDVRDAVTTLARSGFEAITWHPAGHCLGFREPGDSGYVELWLGRNPDSDTDPHLVSSDYSGRGDELWSGDA